MFYLFTDRCENKKLCIKVTSNWTLNTVAVIYVAQVDDKGRKL